MARRKGTNWGLSQIPCVGPLRGLRSTAHLLGLFILGRALENLSMAALTRDFSSADPRRSPIQPLTPLSPILRSRVLFCILSSEMILASLTLPLLDQVLVEIGFVQD